MICRKLYSVKARCPQGFSRESKIFMCGLWPYGEFKYRCMSVQTHAFLIACSLLQIAFNLFMCLIALDSF